MINDNTNMSIIKPAINRKSKLTFKVNSYTISKILRAIAIFIFVFCTLFPFYWVLMISLKNGADTFSLPVKIFFQPTLEHYRKLFIEANFMKYFMNSFITSVIGVSLAMLIGVPAAYTFSKTKFKGDELLYKLILLSRVTPGAVFVIPYYMVYQKSGLLDTKIGLGIIFFAVTFGLVTWSMKPFLEDISPSLEEAARIDGCSLLQTLTKIMLPIATPGLCATAILSFIFCWNEFFFGLILTQRKAITGTVGILNFMVFEKVDWGPIAAGSMIISLPVIIFGIAIRKYFVRGLAAGALSAE